MTPSCLTPVFANARPGNIYAHGAGASRWFSFQAKGDTAHIDIMDEIGGWGISARQLSNQIANLSANTTIRMKIFSPGGDVLEGNEIFNALQAHPGPVLVEIGALCASIATVIACAGDEISIAKNGLFMIHNPWTIAYGEAEDLRKMAEVMDKMRQNILGTYKGRKGIKASEMELSAMMDEETWMTAEEALAKGLVDSVRSEDDEKAEEIADRYDPTRFKNSAGLLSRLPKKRVLPAPAQDSPVADSAARKESQKPTTKPSLIELYMTQKIKVFAGAAPTVAVIAAAFDRASYRRKVRGQPVLSGPVARIYAGPPPLEGETQPDKDAVIKAARELMAARRKQDQEIDDIVLAVRDRDKRDFSKLASRFKQDDKTPDDFARAIVTSKEYDQAGPVAGGSSGEGSGIEVLGVVGLPKGTPGELFVSSAEYRAMIDSFRSRGGKNVRQSCIVETPAFATVQMMLQRMMGVQNTTTSSGLTTIEKLPGVVTLGLRPLMVKDLLAPGATNNTTIRYIQESTFTNAATVVAEGAAKPAASFTFVEVDSPVRKIAAYTKVTDELWADYLAVASLINMRLPYMVERTEEDELLNGDGTGQHLTGILNTAGILTQAKGANTAVDAIYKSFTKVRWNLAVPANGGGFEPDGIVMHPTDWEAIRLSKDGNQQYFGGGPFTGAYGNGAMVQFEMLWGKPVAVTPVIAQGTALTGAFRLAAQYFQRQGMTIESTNTDQDDFIKNLTTIRAEERLALAVYRPAAFCQVTGL